MRQFGGAEEESGQYTGTIYSHHINILPVQVKPPHVASLPQVITPVDPLPV